MTEPAPRRRNAAETRVAILQSAITAFTQHGYDGVGVREIAKAAGVTAMLVNRYFGSKEQLFVEAVDTSFAPRTVVSGDAATLAHEAAVRLVSRTAPDADDLDPFLLMLRSVGNPRTTEIIRDSIEKHVGADLLARLSGGAAPERSELLLALIAGIWLMRKVIGTPALQDADPDKLTPLVEQLFGQLTGTGT
ncbi:TetR family transcriptional regulator [Amycolatopsis taiwanensis]|uniref:TetR family transcriptional regulator n=1 Tax=Amycolatopsis taiwanensis TaxID=342230 RepID=A0A9W6R6Z6_9PSEU|nr:TetR family transcriptional regulator [Amycolatopsis taiwanensis]